MVNKKISSGLRFAFENNFPGPFSVVVLKMTGSGADVKLTGREVLSNLTKLQIEELSENQDVTLITSYLN
jgi:hypothetical protein